MSIPPQITVIAGPNGAGKSTYAPMLLPAEVPFLNADENAKKVNALSAARKDITAGRLLIQDWDELAERHASFAMETTLASRSLASRIRLLQKNGYQFRLIFLWLPSADLAVARVADRVRRGGHDIPETTIRRRYVAGLRNLTKHYLPMSDTCAILQNRESSVPLLIAAYNGREIAIHEPEIWKEIQQYAP